MARPIIAIRYIGDGAFLAGVPARDLALDEWADLAPATRRLCLRLRLYRIIRGSSQQADQPRAHGGPVTGGTPHLIDAGHPPELFIPLERPGPTPAKD